MGKLILLVLLAIAAYLVVRAVKRHAANTEKTQAPSGAPERMVTCARCGVHLPESESLASGERRFCCEEHRRLGA